MVCTTDVLNGKNCLKRSLFDQNFAVQGLYFDQNFEKCTLVAGHFILNQIFKNLDLSQPGLCMGGRGAPHPRLREEEEEAYVCVINVVPCSVPAVGSRDP